MPLLTSAFTSSGAGPGDRRADDTYDGMNEAIVAQVRVGALQHGPFAHATQTVTDGPCASRPHTVDIIELLLGRGEYGFE